MAGKVEITFRVLPEAGDLYIPKTRNGGGDAHVFEVGEHTEQVEEHVARAIAGAAASGGVEIKKGKLPTDHVMSDEEMAEHLDKVLADVDEEGHVQGEWQRGNVSTFIASKEGALREIDEIRERDSVIGVVPEQHLRALGEATHDERDLSEEEHEKLTHEYLDRTEALLERQIADAKAYLKTIKD